MSDAENLRVIRGYLLAITSLALGGLEVELLFLNHVKSPLQLLPVGLGGIGLGVLAWNAVSPNSTSVRILKGILVSLMIVGAIGTAIHLAVAAADHWNKAHGRRGLEHEIPPLAPAAMLPLGLMGLALTFKHPLLEEERFGESFQSITSR